MSKDSEKEVNWNAVIGRSLAYLSLKNSDLKEATLVDQAEFLRGLGLPVKECAAILGSSEASINQLRYKKRKSK
jgi:hypothetical protein